VADSAREGRRVVVICVGNPQRGDDAAGRAVARALGASLGDIDIVEEDGEATRVLARLEGADAAYIVDACVSGAEPGAPANRRISKSLYCPIIRSQR